MNDLKLYMLLLGCKPKGRHTEQHDIFFGIGSSLKDLVPDIINFWPEAEGRIHLDAWREVSYVGQFEIKIQPREETQETENLLNNNQLFFINLGGYKEDDFEEYHYKMIVAAKDKGEAIATAKQTAFYKHTGFKGADSHIDDKYGIDVDDLYRIEDILPEHLKKKYSIIVTPQENPHKDKINLGYFILSKIVEG